MLQWICLLVFFVCVIIRSGFTSFGSHVMFVQKGRLCQPSTEECPYKRSNPLTHDGRILVVPCFFLSHLSLWIFYAYLHIYFTIHPYQSFLSEIGKGVDGWTVERAPPEGFYWVAQQHTRQVIHQNLEILIIWCQSRSQSLSWEGIIA